MNRYQTKIESLNYYHIWGDNTSINNTTEKIKIFEKLIENELPSGYKEFLLNYNCIAFEQYVVFPFLELYPRDEKSMIDIFFGLLSGDSYDLMENYNDYQGRMPSDFIPIASDPGGNILCISVSNSSKGRIFFWDHEDEEIFEDGSCTNQNIYLVAESFDELIDSLEFYIDEDD